MPDSVSGTIATMRSRSPRSCRRRGLALLGLVTAACGSGVEEQSPPLWEHELSDVPVDARFRFGALDNGLRFAWAHNDRPEGRVFLRMVVGVGSFDEKEDERGLTHFVEHMAFEGSDSFDGEALREWFASRSMQHGNDSNASTSYRETVYKLDLTGSSTATLEEGLVVLRMFTGLLAFPEFLVETEKDVLDREAAQSGEERAEQRVTELLYAGSLYASRFPIGDAATRRAVTAEDLRAFHAHWYRPDNVTLVLVGDFELSPEPEVAKWFASWERPPTPLDRESALGTLADPGTVFAVQEETMAYAVVHLQRREATSEVERDDVARRRARIPLIAARSMLQERLLDLRAREDAHLIEISVQGVSAPGVSVGEDLELTCDPATWERAVEETAVELRRVLVHGFTEDEVARERSFRANQLDDAVERERSQMSPELADRLVDSLQNSVVLSSAATDRTFHGPIYEELTPEACRAALEEVWSRGQLALHALGNVGDGASARLTTAFEAGWSAPVEPLPATHVEFAYAFGVEDAGSVVARDRVEDLDLHRLRFENGVCLNVRRTEIEPGQVHLRVAFGEGLLTLEPENIGVAFFAGFLAEASGLGAHSARDLARLFGGQAVVVDLEVDQGAARFDAVTTTRDLKAQCELLAAHFVHAAWSEEQFAKLGTELRISVEMLEHHPGGVLLEEFYPALFGGDPRGNREMPPLSSFTAIRFEDVRDWLAHELATAPIEVTVVGDVGIDDTVALMARTFGALPSRREWRELEEHRDLQAPLAGLRQEHTVATGGEEALLALAYPAPDGMDPEVLWCMDLIARALHARVTKKIRRDLGLTYGPTVKAELSDTHPGVGLLIVGVETRTESAESVLEACLEVGERFAEEGFSSEELEQLKRIQRSHFDGAMENNAVLLIGLSKAQRDPGSLDGLRGHDPFLEALTTMRVNELANTILRRDRASIYIARPDSERTQ